MNLKIAKALSLKIHSPRLARADQVIEWMAGCPLLALSRHRLVRCKCLLVTQSGHLAHCEQAKSTCGL